MGFEEIWSEIPEFPQYEVSNLGNIYNTTRDIPIRTSATREGDIKVSLTGLYNRRTMSVKYLVAQAFVFQPSPLFNAVISMDGNSRNVAAYNLAWRPRWFAWKYPQQFKWGIDDRYLEHHKIVDMNTKIEYSSVFDAATSTGSLMEEVWKSIQIGDRPYPSQGPFTII
jgi:hypothetical protein